MYRGKVLVITDSATAPSGYGNQAKMLFSKLAERGWEIYQLACNCWNLDEQVKQSSDGFYHYKGIKLIKNEELGKSRDSIYPSKEYVARLYNELKPDIVFTLNDFHRVANYIEISQDFIDHWIHWLPVDNDVGNDGWAHMMSRLRYLILLSSFGWDNQSKYLNNIAYLDAIYHAVSSNIFFPLDKNKIKSAHKFSGNFVIATVGRHQPRKMIYHTAEAVCRFLQKHSDALWICKTDPFDSAMNDEPYYERDLVGIARKYGVEKRVVFEASVLSDESMNDFYNSADVFIHLSGGEGFGIPYVESMLAEVPCILNNNTTSPELTGGWEFGLPVSITNKKYVKFFNLTFDVGDLGEALNQLEFCYNDWKNNDSKWLKEAGRKAREFHKYWCDVDKVADRFEEVFQRVIRFNNKILWHCFFGRGVGYSLTSETMIPALERLGYDVYCDDWWSGCSPILEPHFRELYQKYLNSKGVINFEEQPQFVCWLMDAFSEVNGKYKIGWCLLESDQLREYNVKFCNSMDYVVTSSDFCREIIKNSGVCNPIYLMPPNIDVKRFPYLERKRNGTEPFTFLHIGVVQERKNTAQLVDSYVKAFPDNGKTKLIIKSNEFGIFDYFVEKYPDRKDLEFIYTCERPLSHEEYLELLRRADCYINISHGEGIGNPDMEALATGLPVIGSNWDTRQMFLDDEVGWTLKKIEMGPAYFMMNDATNGNWAFYDTDEIIEIMRYVVSHTDECKSKGDLASKRLHENFNSDIAAKELDKLFMDIYSKKVATVNKEHYDEKYFTDTYKYDPAWFQSAADILSKIVSGKVLDIGCGRGYLMKHLIDSGVDIQGFDVSAWAVENPLPGCEKGIQLADLTKKLPYRDKEFDWGISFMALEHIPERYLEDSLKEIFRVCNKLLIDIPMVLKPGMENVIKKTDDSKQILHTFEWWKSKLTKCGLIIEYYDGGNKMIISSMDKNIRPLKPGEKILVTIPSKDRLDSLNRLMDSLIAQRLAFFDVIIIDDSKYEHYNEDSVLSSKIEQLGRMNRNVILARGVGINQATAHNQMMKFADENGYKFVFRVDDDVVLEVDHIEKLYTAFLNDDKCEFAAIGGIILNPYIPSEQQVAPSNWRDLPEFSGKVTLGTNVAQIYRYPDDVAFRDDLEHLYSSYMYRVPLIKSVGGFPNDLSAVAFREETLPLYELYLQGYKMGVDTKAIGYHFHEQKGGCRSVDSEKAELLYKQDEKLFRTKLALLEDKYRH